MFKSSFNITIMVIFNSIFYLKIYKNNIFFYFKNSFLISFTELKLKFYYSCIFVFFKFKWRSFQYFGEFFWLLIVFYFNFNFYLFSNFILHFF